MSDQAFDFDTSRERQQVEAFDRSIAQLEAHLQRLDKVGLGKLQGELHRLAGQGKTELEKLTAAAATEADKLRAVYGRGAGNQQWFSDVQKQKQAAVEALQHVKTEYATLLRHREQVAKAMVHQATKEATETLAVYSKLSTQTLNLVEVNQRRSQLRAKSASKMGLDDTRSLLGLPSRDEMKTLAASIKGQMQEALATSGLRAKSASKMGLDDTRSLLGLPSRDEMKTLAASIKSQMQEAVSLESAKRKGRALGIDPSTVVGSFTAIPGKVGAIPNLKPAAKDANELAGAFKLLSENGNNVHSMARGLASGFNALWLTWGALAPLFAGAAISNGFMQTAKSGMEVANTMKTIEVLGGNTAQQMAALNQEMLNIARTGPFGPKEIAESMKILSLAGLDANEILATTQDVLNFSVAGTTDLKTAADTLVSVSTAFGLGAEGFGRVGDVVAKAAAESKTSVEAFSESMKTASVIHKQYGVSLEDTATALAAMSQLGIEGSAAGTALRNMYADLSGRSEKVSSILKQQGIELRQASGEFRPLIEVVAELDQKFKALKPIDAKNLMQDLLSERGGKAIIELLDMIQQKASTTGQNFSSVLHEMQAKITDSYGFAAISAAQMAQTSQNMFKTVGSNLQASMLEAFAAMEPQLIVIADGLKKAFSSPEFVQGLTSLVSLVASFGAGLVSFTTFVIENTTAVLLAGGAYKAAQVYLASKAAAATAAAAATVGSTAATIADTAATNANNAAKTGGLGALVGLARFLPGIGTAVTIAATAWSLYDMWQNRAKDTSLQAAGVIQNNVLDALNKEADALEKVNAKRAKGLSLSAATAEAALEAQMQEHMTPAKKARFDAETKEAALVKEVNMLREKAASLDGKSSRANAELSLAQAELAKASTKSKEAFDAETQALVSFNQAAQRVVSGRKFKADWQNEEQEKARKATVGRHGIGTYDSEGAAFDKNTWQNVKVATDKTLQELKARQTAVEAQLKSDYSNRKAILDSEHSAGLVSEGQYYARSLTMSMQHEEQMLTTKRAAHDEYVKVAVADYQELQSKIEQIQATPTKGAASQQAKQQNLDQLVAMQTSIVEGISTSFTTLSTGVEELSSKLGTDLTVALNKSQGEVKKLTEAEAEYWAKDAESGKKEQAIAAISEQYRFAVDSVFSLGKAEEAAALAAASSTEKHQQHLVAMKTAYEEAAAAAEELFHILTSDGDLSAGDSKVLAAAVAKRDALRDLLADSKGKAEEAVGDSSAQAFAKVRKTQVDQLSGDISNALVSGLINGGESAKNGLRDILASELTKPVKMVVNVAVNAMLSSVMGSLGLGAASGVAGAAGGSSGVSTALSGASLLGSVGGSVLGGAGWLTGATTLGGSLSAGASLLGTGTLAGAGAGLGMLAGALGPIALGVALLSSAFSRKLKDSGIEGTLGGEEGFEGQSYKFYKGGLLRSDKTTYDKIDPEIGRILSTSFKGIQAQVTDFAQALALPTESINGFTTKIKVSLHGLNKEDAQKALQDALVTGSNELAQQVLGSWQSVSREVTEMVGSGEGMESVTRTIEEQQYVASEFARTGETAIETLTRLGGSLMAVNGAAENLGWALYDSSLAGADAASQFADKFGGAEAFDKIAGEYFAAYYTGAEQLASATRDVSDEFAEMGLQMPQSKRELRDMIDAQMALGTAGHETAASLLQVSGAFANVMDQMQQSIGLTGDSLKSVFQNVLKEANSAEEARMLGEQAAGQLLMDAISNALVGTVTDLVSSAVLQPITQSIVGAAAQAATMDVAAASVAGMNLAAGGAAGGMNVAAGGAAGGANVAAGGAAAGAGLAEIVGRAVSVTNSMVEIMTSADFQAAFGAAVSAIGDISATLFGGMDSVQTSMPGFAGGGSSAISGGGGGGGSSATDNKNPLDDLLEERRQLEIELLKAQGQEQEALNRVRAKAIEGMSAEAVAAWDFNRALEKQIEQAQQVTDLKQEHHNLEIELLKAQGRDEEALALIREDAIKGMAAEAVALYDANQALQEQIEQASKLQDLEKAGANLQVELLKAQGRDEEALALIREEAIKGLSAQAVAQYDANQAVQEQIDILNERKGLERRLLEAQGDTAAIRQLELAATNEANRAILLRIWALEDEKKAAEAAQTAVDAAFDALKRAVQSAQEAAEKALKDTYEATEKTLKEQISAAEKIRSAASESLSSLEGIFDLLKDQIKDLRNEAGAAAPVSEGNAYLDRLIASGATPKQDELADAIDSVRAGQKAERYGSAFEYNRDNLVLAGRLDTLKDKIGLQKTIAEQQLKAAEDSLVTLNEQLETAKTQYEEQLAKTKEYYEKVLENAQTQIDVLRGVDTSVLGVTDAVTALNAAVASAAAQVTAAVYSISVDSDSTTTTTATANDTTVNSRARGGYTPAGLTLVGEEGPELVNFAQPSMVYTSAQTSNLLWRGDSEGVIAELRSLREDNRAQAQALVRMQARLVALMERWDGDGMPEERATA